MRVSRTPCQARKLGGTCQEPLLWLKSTSTGKPAPIDADPSEKGNIKIDVETGTYEIVKDKDELARLREARFPLHQNHWGTCVDADRFRTPKRASA